MKLIVDQGNSVCKLAIYEGDELRLEQALPQLTEDILTSLFQRYNIEASIYSSVGDREVQGLELLHRLCPKTYELGANTPVPLVVHYDRSTLGSDRLASVCGAVRLLGKDAEVLVVDAGTALTFERLRSGGYYQGGNISLGLWMRFKALRHFTKRLPLIEGLDKQMPSAYGLDTNSAIQQGVLRGFLAEVRAYIEEAQEQEPKLQILLTGGDAQLLYNLLGFEGLQLIPQLVPLGLLEILDYNIDIEQK